MEEFIRVQQAQPTDYEKVRNLLFDTAKWLNQKGSSQWKGLLTGNDVHDTAKAIERGEVYLGTIDDEVIGMFVLWDEQTEWDKGLWGEDTPGENYYLHRITVAKDYHGKNLGRQLVGKAVEVAKKDGKKSIRLDCIASNTFLNKFYPTCGFTFVRTVYNHQGAEEAKDFNLYKKNLI